jgi:hypothetical protein
VKARVTEIESRLAVKPNKQEGIQNFDVDNAYPQRIRNAIKASGRTSQCVNIYSRFVRGTGFADPFYKTIVNRKGETIDKIHRKVVFDRVRFRGFALHFNFNLLGEIVEINQIPFEECRLGIADEASGVVSIIKHHPDWAREVTKNFNKKFINEYAVFNPDPDVVLAQIEAAGGIGNYKGQMLYWSHNGNKYPEASCDPVLEDVISDHEASEFRLNNITTNFLASHILETGGFESADEEAKFTKSLENFQGAKRSSRILHMQRTGTEKSYNLDKVEIQDMDGLFKQTEDSTLDSIRRNYMIPAVLLSDLISGKLGTAQEIQDAYAWMNSLTVDDRMIDEEVFTTIFSHWHDQSANPDKNFSAGELRFGEERILVEKLQVGGTQAMKDVIVDALLTPEQKKNILILVFGLKEEDALKIIPTATPTPAS